jgi:uncharacterized protein
MTRIRESTAADFEAVLRLNADSEHLTSPLSLPQLQSLHEHAAYCRVIDSGGGVRGFLLALREGADYDSPNYRWFAARYDEFLYVDRIVIAADSRGQQLGARLYDDLFAFARQYKFKRITCEFDIDPPNEGSRRFHERFGFHEVGRQRVAGGKKEVSLQEAPL